MAPLLAGCTALHLAAPTRSALKPVAARRAATIVMDEEEDPFLLPLTNVTAAVADIKEVLSEEGLPTTEAADDVVSAELNQDLATLTDEEYAALVNMALSEPEATTPIEGLQDVDIRRNEDLADDVTYAPYGAVVSLSDAEVEAKVAWLAGTYGEQPSEPDQEPEPAAPAMTPEVAALFDEKAALDEALERGYDAEKVKRLAEVEAMLAEAGGPAVPKLTTEPSAPAMTPEVAALFDEKAALDAALERGYDAEKVQRLAEVEAMLADAGGPAVQESAPLSAEEAAKAAWLAKNARPSWGGTD